MSMKGLVGVSIMALSFASCTKQQETAQAEEFNYSLDHFYDLQILRYQVPGFEELSLQQKELIYYLSQAAIEGRDILYDQNCKHNLCIRRTLEAVYQNYAGDKETEEFKNLERYLKRIWFSNGIHHHYSEDKFLPDFTADFFAQAVKSIDSKLLPLQEGEDVDALIAKLTPVMFDPTLYMKRTNQAADVDLIATSANNYYGEGVTQAEAEAYYNAQKDLTDETPVSYGLNAKLVKENGELKELVYKTDGLYGAALSKVVYWLEKAKAVAENDQQKAVIEKLIEFNNNGDLETFDEYCVLWVHDLNSRVDFVNGFTETYGDPLGMTASWESVVNFKNMEATQRTEKISAEAQWFEDHSPVAPEFKKDKVKGVTAKVITAAMLGGDCYPSTPIGINLPNANWIRRDYGSKSVTIENITEAYDEAAKGNGFAEEFMNSQAEVDAQKRYGDATDNLHTDLHECLGHGSGKLLPGVDGDALKAYGSTIEEARADLFGLYYVADPKLVELGLLPNKDAYKIQYYTYMMNGAMTQLSRIALGKNIEEAHMRNRQLIANWCLEKGAAENVAGFITRENKTYLVVYDYEKLRTLFGQLLAEIQRIKSTGDFAAAQALVENYGVKVNHDLHKEVLERYTKLDIAPYKGFVNPVYTPVTDRRGNITDIKISYTEGYVEQHLRYSKEFSVLPTYN